KSTLVKGLFYGGGIDQLKAQFIGSLTCVIVVTTVSLALMFGIHMFKLLRLAKDEELEGIDLVEHGTPAYHMEFGQGVSYTTLIGSGTPFAPKATEEAKPPKPARKPSAKA